jgi:hypothetical protein
MQTFLDDRNKHVSGDRNPDLRLHGVLACAQECFDSQMLLDPFEEQFDLPSLTIQIGNHRGGQLHIVGHESDRLASVVEHFYAANSARVMLVCIEQRQSSNLIEDDVGIGSVYGVGVTTLESSVALCTGDKEAPCGVNGVKAFEIDVTPIHQVEGPGFDRQIVEHVDLVHLAIADIDKTGDVALQIEQGVKFDSGLGSTKWSPRMQRQAKVDSSCVERVNRGVQVDAKRLVDVQRSSNADQVLGEVGINLPRACCIGVGQRIARDCFAAKAQVIKSRRLRPQIDLDVSQRFAVSKLREGHGQELIEARKVLNFEVAVVECHATTERSQRQMSHDLSENEFALMHWNSKRIQTAKSAKFQNRCSNRDQNKTSIYSNKSLTYKPSM